ncbi:hypothetical protein LINPERPRIM_LOCUS10996 [Linum perenne]
MVDSRNSKNTTGFGGKSWASVVGSDPNPDLQYFSPVVVDGVLQIPKSVLELGYKELKKALVGQVIGDEPPLRVIQSLANTLWGYDDFVAVSLLPSGLYLIEFPTQSLCDWVYSRLWHVHNQPLLLKRWKEDLEPVVIEPVEVPVWVTLKKVPPPLCNHLGVGHLASQIGKPLSKFTRVGTTVKVCVLLNPEDNRPSSIAVKSEFKSYVVDIEYPEFRAYEKRKPDQVRKAKQVYKQVSKDKDPPVDKDVLAGENSNVEGEAVLEGGESSVDKRDDNEEAEIVLSETPKACNEQGDEVHTVLPESSKVQNKQGDCSSDNSCSFGNDKVDRSGTNSKHLQGDLEDDASGFEELEGIPRAFSPEFFPPLKRGGRRGKKR